METGRRAPRPLVGVDAEPLEPPAVGKHVKEGTLLFSFSGKREGDSLQVAFYNHTGIKIINLGALAGEGRPPRPAVPHFIFLFSRNLPSAPVSLQTERGRREHARPGSERTDLRRVRLCWSARPLRSASGAGYFFSFLEIYIISSPERTHT